MEAIHRSITRLSSHEITLLSRIADGRTNAQLGVELHRSEKTIRNQLTRLYAKLGARNRAEAVAIYVRLEKDHQFRQREDRDIRPIEFERSNR